MHIPEGVTAVIGLGVSGRAICRHLTRLGRSFAMLDTRAAPPRLEAFKAEYPDVAIYCGPLDAVDFSRAFEVVISPGVDPLTPGLEGLLDEHNPATNEPRLVGEIALFKRAVKAPVAAITGANAKSTVTTLLGEMAHASNVAAAVGGNLGTAALDLLEAHPDAELYILELSSFQLETTPRLGAAAVAFLNLSEDHLDRHATLERYRQAKARIFIHAGLAVVNADDPLTWPDDTAVPVVRFTGHAPGQEEWGLVTFVGQQWLARGADRVMRVDALGMAGRHNYMNALAALALGEALGFSRAAMRTVLETFKGLPHRSEVVDTLNGVRFVNDSKGTNVGATLAAIEGIGATLEGRLVLLAGGVGKGADFTLLAAPLARYARQVLVFGADAQRLKAALTPTVAVREVETLEQALEAALEVARPGDCVLLSPACASLDQFANYEARGEAFRQWVLRQRSEVNA
ncbi:UDP-N-acetylmuramoyl-L-alanine--D-glutamate ligase [Halomonas sp. PAMB 3264]|uniref:UDP-N-acetylmuramoyl-L-alanine--D-glutamate ligase n=1 Tax=Halomonas sp. PAMB 3264 TaxID=3075222 RepID=UPI0028A2463B|nr:UDP-N-acetylmuramoyl-L-alanine--D-glutamate ligase [Halomonas sp. PAMB 3264]WNL43693.1 UDP-N-acetylmuramoyl-L-alanine--D-glutamate ligase [Halomonas sp. PAMB 3264]